MDQLLSKMVKIKTTIEVLSHALLILCLLITLYMRVIIIKVQRSEVSLPARRTMTNCRKMYNNNNGTQIGVNKVNTGGNHHMVNSMEGRIS